MSNQDRNIILDIVEEINQEIQGDIGEKIDGFCLEFISDGHNSIILFLGIEIWNEEDKFNGKWIGLQNTLEFRESFMNFIWEKIKQIKNIICKITQYRERKFNFKQNS